MQFTTPTQQQITTCPQCDNVVRIDAEFCNICGKRLQPAANAVGNDQTPVTTPSYLSHAQQAEGDDEYEDDDEYSDEDEDDEASPTASAVHQAAPASSIPPSSGEIITK